MKHFVGIIPARYNSKRLPGKPLIDIFGKPMIQHVYERAAQVLKNVYVATDDERIKKAVEGFGGKVVMTSREHQSGTDRCAEAVTKIDTEANNELIVINIQGDEPFISKEQIKLLMRCFDDEATQIGTLAKKIETTGEVFNPHKPKVVFSKQKKALYFSRSAIPFVRNVPETNWLAETLFFKHIGIYAYRSNVLRQIAELEPSPLEKAEALEQNRWLENGFPIRVQITEIENKAIDTPNDLQELLQQGHP